MEDENKPINEVIDHFNKIEGNAAKLAKTNFKTLPRALKFFGYFLIGFLIISIVLLIILNLLNWLKLSIEKYRKVNFII